MDRMTQEAHITGKNGLFVGAKRTEAVGSVHVGQESPGSSGHAVCLLGENKQAATGRRVRWPAWSFHRLKRLLRGVAEALLRVTVASRSGKA